VTKPENSTAPQKTNRDAAAARSPLPDAYPPDSYRSLAAEYPWLTVFAGVGLGMLAGALVPRTAGARLGKRAIKLATQAGELGLTLSARARDRAGEIGRESIAQIEDRAAIVRKQADQSAASAKATGAALLGEAIRLVAKARK
jgi:hypothetical protein